jgi:hypothetical protein
MSPSRGARSLTFGLKLLAGNALVLVVLLLLLEGAASYAVVLHDSWTASTVAEHFHSEYDPDLGWINKPDVSIPDMYGPGIYLKTNAQRFRANQDIQPSVPSGKRRIVCSGDSFTLGYGVSNDETWCHLLAVLNPSIETVNMGQGGYGLDQAYLWYKRDASKLEHDVHVVAFVTVDFDRMNYDSFFNFGKPLLRVENGELVTTNVPVPRQDLARWLTSLPLGSIRSLRVATRLATWRRTDEASGTTDGQATGNTSQRVVAKIFEDLKRLHDEQSRTLLLVYIPTQFELSGSGPEDWRAFIDQQARALRIPLVSLFDSFRALPYEQVMDMYIPAGRMSYPGAAGHLTARGNRFVADAIHKKLMDGSLTEAGTLHP